MKFTSEQLQLMSEGKSVGDSFPYKNGSEEDIENYLKGLYSKLNQSGRLICDGEFDHYGSGYASFVEFFCFKKDGSSILSKTEMNDDGHVSEKLGVLYKENHGLNINDEEEFRSAVTNNLPPQPNSYQEIREMNMGKVTPDLDQQREMEIGPNYCAVR